MSGLYPYCSDGYDEEDDEEELEPRDFEARPLTETERIIVRLWAPVIERALTYACPLCGKRDCYCWEEQQ